MLTEISGTFVKIAFAADVGVILARGMASRPAARFNRPGQDALYLSPDEASAKVAIGQYVKPGDAARVLVRFEVERCKLLDLRHPEAEPIHALAAQPWLPPLARGTEPASWQAADHVRHAGHAGLIDPSRRQPGLWHVTLLRWNEPGGPLVRQIEDPVTIELLPERP